MISNRAVRLSAVGDISFEGAESDNPSLGHFQDVTRELAHADLSVGNLECVLTHYTVGGIPGKCVLRGSRGWARVLREAGIGLVSLANNHIMDFGARGLISTIEALEAAGVTFVGAGRNRKEAYAPVFRDVGARRVAFLARSSVFVNSPTNATDDLPGIAFLSLDETSEAIRSCRLHADIVILLVHWGVEEYSYPSPTQRVMARRLIAAGTDAILGHHPHVLQGYERIGRGTVFYSLGNFVFDEFTWNYCLPDGRQLEQFALLSRENRNGAVVTLEWDEGAVPTVRTSFTGIGRQAHVSLERTLNRQIEWNRLCRDLRKPFYPIRWRWYAIRREFTLRFVGRVSLRYVVANVHRIRLRHVGRVLTAVTRSLKIVSERTTNPYD